MSSNDEELHKKLLLHDEEDYKVMVVDDVEEQKKLLQATKVRRSFTTTKKSGGCGWCQCVGITLLILMSIGFILSGITYLYVKDVVQHLTVTTPHDSFPVVRMSKIQLKVVEDRVTLFVDELFARAGVDPMDSSSDDSSSSSSSSDSSSSDSSSSDSSDDHSRRRRLSSPSLRKNDEYDELDPLVITQDEINGLLGQSDYLRGNMYVTLENNSIREEYSLPTWMLPGGNGRYFVGEDNLVVNPQQDTIYLNMTTAAKHHDWFDGPLLMAQLHYLIVQPRSNTPPDDHQDVMLQLYLDRGSFFGQDAPQDFIDQHQNLLQDVYGDSGCDHARAILSGIEQVIIETGKITFVPRN